MCKSKQNVFFLFDAKSRVKYFNIAQKAYLIYKVIPSFFQRKTGKEIGQLTLCKFVFI